MTEPMTDERCPECGVVPSDKGELYHRHRCATYRECDMENLREEIRRLHEENERLRRVNKKGVALLGEEISQQKFMTGEIAKLRKVVEHFRENHYCEYRESGKGPCDGCEALRELDEADNA